MTPLLVSNALVPPTPSGEGDPARAGGVRPARARGWADERVAQALSPGEEAVRIHVSNVLSSPGARDRVEAVRIARRQGLSGAVP